MTPEEITAMAKEAGFPFNKYGLLQGDDDGEIDADAAFASFADLVAEKAAAQEREACAQVCEEVAREYEERHRGCYPDDIVPAEMGADACAAAIRARGQKESA